MKQTMVLILTMTAALAAAEPDSIRTLRAEVQQVALEVKQLKLDLASSWAAGLQRELEWVQARRQKLESQERALTSRMIAAQQQQIQPSPEERREWNDSAGEMPRLTTEREALMRREAELAVLLDGERRRMDGLRAAVAAIEKLLHSLRPATVPGAPE